MPDSSPAIPVTTLRRLAVLALASLALATSLAAASPSPYAAALEEAYPADGPGAAVIVVKDGEVLFRGARGMADLELGVPLVPEHVFRLGSITKQFTAAAILKLAEDGKLSVDDEITKFLPDYPTHGHHITVEHLLTHTSGIFSYTSIPGYMADGRIRADLTTDELVDVFDDLAMEFVPGERWNYNNSGYVLLGAIIEKASGLSYADYLEQEIFEPLGMENSHYGGSQIVPRRVEGYMGTPGEYANAPFLSMTQPHAAGSLLSTVDDLARWQAALFAGEVVSAETLERMTRRFALTDGEEVDYGYGFQISDLRGEPMIHHGGGIFGFTTHALWLPGAKVFVAVLSNSPQNPVSPPLLSRRMAAEAMGSPFPGRTKIEVAPEKLDDYVGVYRIDEETTRSVILEDGALFTERSDGGKFQVHPYAEDAFYYEDSLSYVTFERGDDGEVAAMHLYPNGQGEAEVSPRTSEAAAAAPEREAADVSPELYDLWAGRYEMQPGVYVEMRREGDRLISQITGQPPAELFPLSPSRYFLRVAPAEVEMVSGEDGRAEAVVIHQGGQEIRAERVD